MRSGSACIAACAAFAFAFLAVAGDERQLRKVSGPIDNDIVWEGRVLVEQPVSVSRGARLTVRPGAEILFARGASLEVAGVLVAVGSPDNLIRFGSADPSHSRASWKGITLAGAGDNTVLRSVAVSDAEEVRIDQGAPEISGCTIERGTTGVLVNKDASGKITGNTISDMTGNGIDCQPASNPAVVGNRVSRCGESGIVVQRTGMATVTGNRVRDCANGLLYGAPAPPPEGNHLDNNKVGIYLTNVGDGMRVVRNRLTGNKTGIWIEDFSAPRIEGNVFDNNAIGIFCFRSSGPDIVHNRISGSREGISCAQLSPPNIEANDISGNGTGVTLTLSSYARINGNNFDNNAVHVRLDNMSNDWEIKVMHKPQRGKLARTLSLIGQGRAVADKGIKGNEGDEAAGTGAIDATGNWWGVEATAEMTAKGPSANIGSLVDWYDVPTRSYEGYPGEYVQDRINYRDWKTSRIPDAGVRAVEGEVPAK